MDVEPSKPNSDVYLKFEFDDDQGAEPFSVKYSEAFNKLTVISSGFMNAKAEDRETACPFYCKREAGIFILKSVEECIHPEKVDLDKKPEYWITLQNMSLENQRDVLVAADFHGFQEMLRSTAAVIAQRMKDEKWTVEKIARFMGY